MGEYELTAAALAAGLLTIGWAAWLERRPRQGLNPRLVPTTPILFAGMLVAILALVHLLNLHGFKTGR